MDNSRKQKHNHRETGNRENRLWAIGDIHGCDKHLEQLLNAMNPKRDDTVILLGDVVDRGPNSARVVEMLLQLTDETNLILIMGNHEEMMINAIKNPKLSATMWLQCGGEEALESYGNKLANIPEWHVDFLSSGIDYYETPEAVFVHANLEPGIPLNEQASHWLRWKHLSGSERQLGDGRLVICGHSKQPEGPLYRNGWVCLDTGAYGGGVLTALEITSRNIIIASPKQVNDSLTLEDFAT